MDDGMMVSSDGETWVGVCARCGFVAIGPDESWVESCDNCDDGEEDDDDGRE